MIKLIEEYPDLFEKITNPCIAKCFEWFNIPKNERNRRFIFEYKEKTSCIMIDKKNNKYMIISFPVSEILNPPRVYTSENIYIRKHRNISMDRINKNKKEEDDLDWL